MRWPSSPINVGTGWRDSDSKSTVSNARQSCVSAKGSCVPVQLAVVCEHDAGRGTGACRHGMRRERLLPSRVRSLSRSIAGGPGLSVNGASHGKMWGQAQVQFKLQLAHLN